MTKTTQRDAEWARARAAARLAACLAIFELEFTGKGADAVIADFRNNRFAVALPLEGGAAAEGPALDWGALDEAHFERVARGVVADQTKIDAAIRDNLARDWRFSRIDSTSRAILRAGVYELLSELTIPARTVIDEYVEVAKAFFDDETPAFVNGVLDSVARAAREAELAR